MYEPLSIFHSPVDGIIDGDRLNSANLNRSANESADNNRYVMDNIVKVLSEIILPFFKTIAYNGFDIYIDGSHVKVKGGTVISGYKYATLPDTDLGVLISNDYYVTLQITKDPVNQFLYTPVLQYVAVIPADTDTVTNLNLAVVHADGSITWNIKNFSDGELASISFLHAPNQDTHTVKPDFFVGGAPGTSNAHRVSLLPVGALGGTPQPVKNFRIDSMTSDRSKYTDSTMNTLLSAVIKTKTTKGLIFTLKWNYDFITGVGGNNTFTVNNALSFAANELAGYYIYIWGLNKNLAIISNSATLSGQTVLNIQNEDGSATDLTGITVSTLTAPYKAAWIHSGADTYQVIATPLKPDGTPDIAGSVQQATFVSDSANCEIANMGVSLELETGAKYIIKVRSLRFGLNSDYTILDVAGSLVKYPDISNVGVSVNAQATSTGFVVNIVGWDDADSYEICYTTDSAGADFMNVGHIKEIIYNKSFDKVTGASAMYYFKIRPLIGGQQVATPVTTSVTSGSSVSPPRDSALVDASLSVLSITGSLSSVVSQGNGLFAGVLSNVLNASGYRPSGTAIIGCILADGAGREYVVVDAEDVYSGSTFTFNVLLQAKTGNTSPTTGNISTDTTQSGRTFTFGPFTTDYQIYRLRFQASSISYPPGGDSVVNIKLYQQNYQYEAQILSVNASSLGTDIFIDTNIIVTSNKGERILVAELYDASNVNRNMISATGSISIFGSPYVARG